jgi:peptidoglycan hydrolase-like protein with peptidoglycan-binding domain/tetratricopeptide (TPR) repeat protein
MLEIPRFQRHEEQKRAMRISRDGQDAGVAAAQVGSRSEASGGRAVQMRAALRGMSFDEGASTLAPARGGGSPPVVQRMEGDDALAGGGLEDGALPEVADGEAEADLDAGAPASSDGGAAGGFVEPEARRVLRRGSKGDQVAELQGKLNGHGVAAPPLVVDGDFGPATERAVVAFQESRGLATDGVCGPLTWGALDEAPAGGLPAPGPQQPGPQQPGPLPGTPEGPEPGPPEGPAPEAGARPTLRAGDSGPKVAELQLKLDAAGVSLEGLDDEPVFGPRTQAALVEFQRTRGLVPDGVCGPASWAALDDVSAPRVMSAEQLKIAVAFEAAGDQLLAAGAFASALEIYLDLYQTPDLPPERRPGCTLSAGVCLQGLGRFDEATTFFQEFLRLPTRATQSRRGEALDHLRECRLGQPPGGKEAEGGPEDGPDIDIQLAKAETLYHAKSFEAARGVFQAVDATRRARTEPMVGDRALVGLASCAHQLGEFQRAIPLYETFIESGGFAPLSTLGVDLISAYDRVRECRVGKKPGELSGKDGGADTPLDRAALTAQADAASALVAAGDFVAARAVLRAVYETPGLSPGDPIKARVTFDLATCEHGLGSFGEALSLYQEFLLDPGSVMHMSARNATQRMRECRAGKPPGTLESELAQKGRVA